MKVSLNTYGGLSPRLGAPPRVVDSSELADHDHQELQRLVSAAMASAASGSADSDLLRDAQTYQITVESGLATTVLEASDGSVPDAFAALRNWLREH